MSSSMSFEGVDMAAAGLGPGQLATLEVICDEDAFKFEDAGAFFKMMRDTAAKLIDSKGLKGGDFEVAFKGVVSHRCAAQQQTSRRERQPTETNPGEAPSNAPQSQTKPTERGLQQQEQAQELADGTSGLLVVSTIRNSPCKCSGGISFQSPRRRRKHQGHDTDRCIITRSRRHVELPIHGGAAGRRDWRQATLLQVQRRLIGGDANQTTS
ncbi:hypothetical protein M885DRAFT_63947 [Pelagophyceae sp. CCMP2097]|nr:hypothetical protein M885DRAFT_63947 [Pelagophyceae sp. CCMP2097]